MNVSLGSQIADLNIRVTSIRSRGKAGGAIFAGLTDAGQSFVAKCDYTLLPDASVVDKGQVWNVTGPITIRSITVKDGDFVRREQVIDATSVELLRPAGRNIIAWIATYPHKIISTPFVGEPGSISSETYLCIGPFNSKREAENASSYLSCRLTRLLILLHKPSQHVTRKVYTFVPTQSWKRRWTDEALYTKYGLTEDEIAFIEKVVRPMDVEEDSDGE